jgi:hypothetical protein
VEQKLYKFIFIFIQILAKSLPPPPAEPPTRTRKNLGWNGILRKIPLLISGSVDSYFDKNEPVGENFSAEGPWNKPPMPSKSNPNMHNSKNYLISISF